MAKVEKAVEERKARIDSLQARIHEVQDRIFGTFSRKVGIDNIREYMESNSHRNEKAAVEKMKLAKQVRPEGLPEAVVLYHLIAHDGTTDLKRRQVPSS